MKTSLRYVVLFSLATLSLGVALSATRLKLPAFSRGAGGAAQEAPAISADKDAKDAASIPQSVRDAIVQTDKADYLAGEVVVITGSGWEPGEIVTILVQEEPSIHSDRKLSVVADSLGRIFDNQFVPESHDVGVMFIVSARGVSSGGSASTMAAQAKPAANLDQWANCALNQVCPGSWQNGNLNGSQAHYSEGDSVPYRAVFSSLVAGATYTATIEWDTTQSGKHAIDYLTTWNRTENPNPCAGVAGIPAGACSSPTTFAIPVDANVTNGPNEAPGGGDDIIQIPGNFTVFNGSIGGVSAYTRTGTYAGTSKTSIVVTFSAGADGTAVLAWGGHISTRVNWGLGSSAVAISGSPFHMRLVGFTCSNVSNCGVGQQDRSLSADAVIFPGSITIIKNAVPDHAQDFAFSATGGLSPSSFTLDNDDTLASPSATPNTQAYPGIVVFTNYTVTETAVSNWSIGISCAITSPNGGSASGSGGTATINLKEGENATCTFTNTLQQGTLTVIKNVVNDNGGNATASNFTLSVKSGGSHVSGSPAAGSATGTAYTLPPGTYVVSEDTPPTGYSQTGFSGDCNSSGSVTIANGDSKTCTITNDDESPTLTLIKSVTNNNGGNAGANDFGISIDGGGVTSGVANNVSANAAHTINEAGLTGYSFVSITGHAKCPAVLGGSVTLDEGEDVTCTITNDDQAATLIVKKVVTNDNGGTKVASDFSFQVNAGTATAFEADGQNDLTVDAGTYSVTEPPVAGYGTTYDNCSNLQIPNGGSATCTITNDDSLAGTTSTTTMSWTLKDTMNLGDLRRAPASDPDACGDPGTVTFYLYRYDLGTPDASLTCGAANLVWTSTDPATPGGPPTPAIPEVNGLASISHDISQDGIYLWVVVYSGDSCNSPATNDCGREVTRITSEDLTDD